MFCYEYGNKTEPSYQTLDQFAIFFLWVVIFCHFGPLWAYFRAFWGPYTPTESSCAAKFLGMYFGMGTETKSSLHIRLLHNLQFFSCGWSFSVIWGLYGPILGRFEVLISQQNPPPELNFLEYVLVLVGKKKKPSSWTLEQFANFSPVGGRFLSSGAYTALF